MSDVNGVRTIPVSRLRVSKVNPRRSPGDVSELAASIRQIGLIEPIVCAPDGKGFIVLAGSRRLAAAIEAGMDRIPAVVREGLSEEEREVLMLSENLHRKRLSHLEEASVYLRLMKLFGLTQLATGERCGVPSWRVSQHIAYTRLPKSVIDLVENGDMPFTEALGLERDNRRAEQKKMQRRGFPVTTHKIDGHAKCHPDRCEVRALADQLGVSA
jgi:ParB family chromosome partitioning protein